ncbi:hypothetical protein TNCT_733621 [Trichonephila clavata]|uniref:Uncharacterized protein n=1 Tax=Trichonephila clavata TaxID=2740835 RepID=A0A8X6GLN9_TRICU|nr:hypothetical protein TNCT_508361 [Trichonephila clavata]GFQ95861.1 hypothetical protein TNCT_733621 [Trichonephila clavata]
MRVFGRWGSWWGRVDRDGCVVHFGKFPKSANYWESGVCRTSSRGGQTGVGELGKRRAFQVQVARIELYGCTRSKKLPTVCRKDLHMYCNSTAETVTCVPFRVLSEVGPISSPREGSDRCKPCRGKSRMAWLASEVGGAQPFADHRYEKADDEPLVAWCRFCY